MLTLFSSFRARLFLGVMALLLGASAGAASPKITIEGGGDRLRDNVRSFIGLADEPCETPLWRLRARMRELDRQITSAGEALGFYHLEFSRELSRAEECWSLSISLTPGEPVRLDQVRIDIRGEGAGDSGFESLKNQQGMRQGDRLDHGQYESFKSRFGPLASSRGYFEGRFERSRVVVDREKNTADVEVIYDTGPRYHFGEITLKHDILHESLIRRYLNFEPGEPYDTDRLLDLKSRFNASDYFRSVRVTPRLQQLNDQRVPVTIELEGRNRHSYSVGAGYATDTGPRLLLGYENRYLNGRGHSFQADAEISEVGTNVEASYRIPMSRPAHEYVRLYTGFNRERTDDTRSDVTTLGTSYTRSEEDSDWLQTYSLNYEREFFVVGDEPEQRSDLLIPAFNLSRTKSDNSNYPLSGWSLLGRISGSPSSLGSDTSFVQLYGRGKYIQALGAGRVLLRLEGGVTEVDEFNRLPVSQRFFAGGDSSVRGYDYKSLGPTVISPETGEPVVVGGNNLLATSVEYDYRVLPSWAVAAFYDQGNAFDHADFDLKRSVGVGLRWISPIGPVRVDVAKALDGDRGWKLHLSMGPDL
ncbi:autotransporter assembly complex protein TamA [Marinimicrobium sp. C2-29]|uniref:autotransporter assembly complex protein TamA n=1 Tax=Marinimicrobium sp. C2-29 TaxID=3139825 RepID=UPI003139808D